MTDKKRIYFIVLLFLSQIVYAQNNELSIGTVDSLYSNILHEQRKIFVYVPFSETSVYAKKTYPVIYLLDGEKHFKSFVGMIEYLSQIYDNMLCPEMIVVGIVNTDRIRDFTPTYDPIMKMPTCGGGERFTSFMETELIPFINRHYPTSPYRMLIGHSFGGLLTINTMINHTQIFNSYIAIDPSLWWNQQKLMKQADSDLCRKNFEHKSLYVAIANTINKRFDTTSVQNDTAENTKHIRSILHFVKTASKCNANGLAFFSKYYLNDSHVSVPFIAEYDGLRSIFPWYNFTNENYNNLFGASINADSVNKLIERHFENVSAHMNYNFLPPENFINNLALNFINTEAYSKAYILLMMNLKNYPNSANVYKSLGDYYTKLSDLTKASIYYQEASAKKRVIKNDNSFNKEGDAREN